MPKTYQNTEGHFFFFFFFVKWNEIIQSVKMASETMSPLANGDIVQFQQAACKITDIQKALGYNQYRVVDLNTGVTHVAFSYQLIRDPAFMEAVQRSLMEDANFEMEAVHVGEEVVTTNNEVAVKSRWGECSEMEVIKSAENRQSDRTVKSTGWAVRLFRGRWSLPKWMCEMGQFRRN